jgi:hypothetical protein
VWWRRLPTARGRGGDRWLGSSPTRRQRSARPRAGRSPGGGASAGLTGGSLRRPMGGGVQNEVRPASTSSIGRSPDRWAKLLGRTSSESCEDVDSTVRLRDPEASRAPPSVRLRLTMPVLPRGVRQPPPSSSSRARAPPTAFRSPPPPCTRPGATARAFNLRGAAEGAGSSRRRRLLRGRRAPHNVRSADPAPAGSPVAIGATARPSGCTGGSGGVHRPPRLTHESMPDDRSP